MVTQPVVLRKYLSKISIKRFMEAGPLPELFDKLNQMALDKKLPKILLPCCGKTGDYWKYGTYKRSLIDARIETEDGVQLIVLDYVNVEVLRIECGNCENYGKLRTHALLYDYIVPFGKYSLRTILICLYRLLQLDMSVPELCAEVDVSESTVYRWLAWFKNNIHYLTYIGVLDDLKAAVKWFLSHFDQARQDFIQLMNRCPFQRKKTHPHSPELTGEMIIVE